MTMPLAIREVVDRRDVDLFVKMPWPIYRDCPQWVPPLLIEVKEFIDPRRHPFYRHGEAVKFLAMRGDVVVGRLLASHDPHYNEYHHDSVGCFGLFESVDDPEVAAALIEAGGAWLRSRGMTRLRGPIDYSANYPLGLLVEGFDQPPRLMMNYQPPYYARLLESCGLEPVQDFYAWWYTDSLDLVEKWRERAQRILARGHIRVRGFDRRNFAADLERCKKVYNGARHDNWGYVKLSDAEFEYMARRINRITNPELVLLAEYDGEPVGFSVTVPDWNEAIKPLNGRLTTWGIPTGLARLAYRSRRIHTVRMMVLDLLEGYRRRGVAELLILQTVERGRSIKHICAAELGWTLADNWRINRVIEAVGGRRYKTYRVYEKPLV